MTERRKIFLAFGLVLALILCAACSPARKPVQPTPAPTKAPNIQQGTAITPQPPTTKALPGTPATLSDTISSEVAKMSGVKSCYSLVVGRTAFIGVNLDNGLSTQRVNDLKKSIADKAKSFKNINEALVSADPALIKQIRDISEGKSTPGTVSDLYSRLKPQTP